MSFFSSKKQPFIGRFLSTISIAFPKRQNNSEEKYITFLLLHFLKKSYIMILVEWFISAASSIRIYKINFITDIKLCMYLHYKSFLYLICYFIVSVYFNSFNFFMNQFISKSFWITISFIVYFLYSVQNISIYHMIINEIK